MTTERPNPTPTFRELLRQHRLAAGLTQEELAERAGLSARGISDLERGARGYPHPDTVRRLASALALPGDVSAAFLQAAPRLTGRPIAPDTDRRSFPVPMTPLIGREVEAATICRWLREDGHRLITLHGPGGMGKTRLSLAVAERMVEAFRDGQAFVDLAPLRDPTLLVAQIAAALGLQEHPGQPLQETLAAYLRPRQMLLVLDNFEQLLPAAPVVADLLRAAPDLHLLVTSRAPLRLQGERLFQVPPLGKHHAAADDLDAARANDAVRLFVARAEAVQADFALTAENAATVLAICRRLEGLPLALELAAARINILPLATLQDRLSASLPFLTSGPRDAPERHRTLRDAIAWSDALLEPPVRAFFHRLGIFVGGWTLEAADELSAISYQLSALGGAANGGNRDTRPPTPQLPDILDLLTALVDLNLVQVEVGEAGPRYTMLETIREFAREQLDAAPDAILVTQAHAAYFQTFVAKAAARLYTREQGEWTRRLDVEMPNLRAALQTLAQDDDIDAHLRVVTNLGDFWFRRSHFAEGLAQLEAALARDDAPSLPRAEAMLWVGALVCGQGDLELAEMWLQRCETLARSQDAPVLQFDALFWRGVVADSGDQHQRAFAHYKAALAVARDRDYPKGIGSALTALAPIALQRGDLELAEQWNTEALPYLRAAGDLFDLSMVLAGRGEIALARGDLERAEHAFEEAMAYALSCDVAWLIANALVGVAAVANARGEHAMAAQLLGASDTIRLESLHQKVPSFYLHAETTRRVRAALSESAFLAAWEKGRMLSRDEALDVLAAGQGDR